MHDDLHALMPFTFVKTRQNYNLDIEPSPRYYLHFRNRYRFDIISKNFTMLDCESRCYTREIKISAVLWTRLVKSYSGLEKWKKFHTVNIIVLKKLVQIVEIKISYISMTNLLYVGFTSLRKETFSTFSWDRQ